MEDIDPALLVRIDALVGVLALALVIASIALMAVDLVIGAVCLVVVGAGMSAGVKATYGYSSPLFHIGE